MFAIYHILSVCCIYPSIWSCPTDKQSKYLKTCTSFVVDWINNRSLISIWLCWFRFQWSHDEIIQAIKITNSFNRSDRAPGRTPSRLIKANYGVHAITVAILEQPFHLNGALFHYHANCGLLYFKYFSITNFTIVRQN